MADTGGGQQGAVWGMGRRKITRLDPTGLDPRGVQAKTEIGFVSRKGLSHMDKGIIRCLSSCGCGQRVCLDAIRSWPNRKAASDDNKKYEREGK